MNFSSSMISDWGFMRVCDSAKKLLKKAGRRKCIPAVDGMRLIDRRSDMSKRKYGGNVVVEEGGERKKGTALWQSKRITVPSVDFACSVEEPIKKLRQQQRMSILFTKYLPSRFYASHQWIL